MSVNGKKGCHVQPTRFGHNESGYYSVVEFHGTKNEIQQRAAAYSAIGAFYEIQETHGNLARLSVYLSWANANQLGQEVPVNVWEFEAQEVEKDLLDADFPFASTYTGDSPIGVVSKLNKQVVSKALRELPEDDELGPSYVLDGTQSSASSLYHLMRAGVRSFPIRAPVIRHTAVVSNRYATQAVYTNVGRIISSSSMTSLEGVPSNLLWSVPIEPGVTQFIETSGDLQYGWRKVDPGVTQAALNKWQIVRRWQFGLWAIKLHGAVL